MSIKILSEWCLNDFLAIFFFFIFFISFGVYYYYLFLQWTKSNNKICTQNVLLKWRDENVERKANGNMWEKAREWKIERRKKRDWWRWYGKVNAGPTTTIAPLWFPFTMSMSNVYVRTSIYKYIYIYMAYVSTGNIGHINNLRAISTTVVCCAAAGYTQRNRNTFQARVWISGVIKVKFGVGRPTYAISARFS